MQHVVIGTDANIDPDVRIGFAQDRGGGPIRIGERSRIRSGTVIYPDVEIGDDFRTGHGVLVRESTSIGDDVLCGTNTVIENRCEIGSHVSLQTNVYLPTNTTIGDEVFLGPQVVLTNDNHPVRNNAPLAGPTVQSGASIGAGAIVLPGVTIGRDAFVAAGAIVTRDVPPRTLAIGTPAAHRALPRELRGGNQLA